MRKMLRFRHFSRADGGVAAIEMALVLPFLVLLFLGTVEISRYYLISKRANNVAASMAQLLSTSTTARPEVQLHFIAGGIYTIPTIEPDTRAAGNGVWGAHNVSLASIEFIPVDKNCQTSNCNFDAMVRYSYSVDNEKMRPCGKATKVSDNVSLTSTTLPQSLYGSGSVLVADISYAYKPLFGTRFFGEMTLFRSAFMAPRYMPIVPFGPAKAPNLRLCS